MNTQQEHLLGLLKEIDWICRKYEITYYTAGGTVIGAARHKGFIPWDDDVDLYMDRENFEKFRIAVKKENLPNRKVECRSDNENYHATIPRYNEETTTQICRYHLLGKPSGGLLIDILIMDDYPNDPEERELYLAKLNVYADFIAVPYTHAQRNIEKHLDLYDVYKRKAKELGEEAVIKELEEELFNYKADECDNYILRWAGLANVFSKKMLGKPVYLPFEDMMVPVPEDWYGYLVQLYGDDWMNVPLAEGQDTHIAVSSMEVPYKVFMSERNRFISQKKLRNLYLKRKRATIDFQKVRRPMENYLLEVKGNLVTYEISTILKEVNIENLFAGKDYNKIVDCFSGYIILQTSVLFAGELKHSGWTRWIQPKIIPIDKRLLEILLISLIKSNKFRVCGKLINVYQRAGKEEELSESAVHLYEKVKNVEKLYYLGQYDDCIAEFDFEVLKKIERTEKYFWLAQAKANPTSLLKAELQAMIEDNPCSVELNKAYGDVLYALGATDLAFEKYNYVVEHSRNGMFWNDISEKMEFVIHDLESTTPYAPTNIELFEKKLFFELVDFFEKNEIKYVVGSSLAAKLLRNGNIGYRNEEKTIYMDADNAQKFIELFEKQNPSDRRLISWMNHPTMKNCQIIYSDTNSVYARLNQIEEWIGIGVHITIIILRNNELLQRKFHYTSFLENLLTLTNLHSTSPEIIDTKRNKYLYRFSKMFFKYFSKEKFAKRLFKRIIAEERRYSALKYCYRQNKVQHLYKIRPFSASYYNDIERIDIENHSVAVPRKVCANYDKGVTKYISNVPPKESLFFLVKENLSWSEFESIINLDDIRKLSWQKYELKNKALQSIEKDVKLMWKIMYRGKEKIEFYCSWLDADKIGRRRLIREYHSIFMSYREKGLSFYVTPQITKRYCKYLRTKKKYDYADEVENSATPKDYRIVKDYKKLQSSYAENEELNIAVETITEDM